MTRYERAAQIWPLLSLCASHRQILTYEELSGLIGVPKPGLGQLLDPVQSYCLARGLPPLTSLVVSEVSGVPSEGFIGSGNVPKDQMAVFHYDWVAAGTPSPEDFEAASEV